MAGGAESGVAHGFADLDLVAVRACSNELGRCAMAANS